MALLKISKKLYVYVIASTLLLFILYRIAAWYLKPSAQGFANAEGVYTFGFYYADWCPHCKTVKPVFADWSSSGSTTVNGQTVFLSAFEADKDAEKVKALGAPVKGYPTFLLQKPDGSFIEFSGDRTPAGWKSWLQENVKA